LKRFNLMLEGKHDEDVPKVAPAKEEKKKDAPKEE
jgi:glutamyl-tRNA synthetase